MIERLKSILLVVLVLGSLMQSYLLAYSKPNFIPIRQTEYIRPELAGTEKELIELVSPNEMILHFGNNRHSLLYPNHYFFKEIFGKLEKRTFDGFVEANISISDMNVLRNRHIGLEVSFSDEIPMFVLQQVLQLRNSMDVGIEDIDRIWITTTDVESEVKAYFLSDMNTTIYEARRVDLTVNDLTQYVNFASYLNALNNYSVEQFRYYIPEFPIHMPSVQVSYELMTPQQLQNSLFVDPSISRNLLERDGTEIFTDGKRGLQINRMKRWMSYSDPIVTAQQRTDPETNLQTVIQFVNHHGGWNREYTLEWYPDIFEQSYTFQQRYNSYPILASDEEPFGYLKVTLEKGVVTSYERSLIRLGLEVGQREDVTLPGGDDLRALIRHSNKSVQRLFPAYRAVIEEDQVKLIPAWAIKTFDDTYELLQ